MELKKKSVTDGGKGTCGKANASTHKRKAALKCKSEMGSERVSGLTVERVVVGDGTSCRTDTRPRQLEAPFWSCTCLPHNPWLGHELGHEWPGELPLRAGCFCFPQTQTSSLD